LVIRSPVMDSPAWLSTFIGEAFALAEMRWQRSPLCRVRAGLAAHIQLGQSVHHHSADTARPQLLLAGSETQRPAPE
jgi:hypothetical protein